MNSEKDLILPSNKKFGIFFTFIFCALSLIFFIKKNIFFFGILFSLSIAIGALTIFKPNKLLVFNKIWMKFGYYLGRLINPLIMGLIFFILFFPISIFFKVIGRDVLVLKKNKKKSFWIPRNNQQINNDFKNQF